MVGFAWVSVFPGSGWLHAGRGTYSNLVASDRFSLSRFAYGSHVRKLELSNLSEASQNSAARDFTPVHGS